MKALWGKLLLPPVALAVASTSVPSCESRPQYRLKQAHVIIRHGARTPVFHVQDSSVDSEAWRGKCEHVNIPPGIEGSHVLPLESGKPRQANVNVRGIDGQTSRPSSLVDSFQLRQVFGECRAGQLTDLGAEQSAALGRELMQRYGAMVAEAQRKPDGLYLRSSNVARCVATLSFVLGAMEVDPDAPIRTAHAHVETLYPNHHCLLTNQLLKAAAADWSRNPGAEARELQAELKVGPRRAQEQRAGLIRQGRCRPTARLAISALLPPQAFTDLRLDTFNFVRVRDFFSTYRAHGLEIPWKVPAELCDRVEKLGSMQVARYIYHDERDALGHVARQVGVGALLGVLADAVTGDSPQVFSLIAGHDTTLMPLMSVFGWDGQTWPGFCAWVAVEVWSDGECDEVHIVYSGDTVRVLSVDEFRAIVLPLVPEDWKQACLETRPELPQIAKGDVKGDHW